MLLSYSFRDRLYKIFIHWTADAGNSAIFQEIVQKISHKHQLDLSNYGEMAKYLDTITDKLYEQFYIFSDEHSGIPYNPRFRKIILRAFAEISDTVKECLKTNSSEHENLLNSLFMDVVDKLQEMVDIYLVDNAYQCKFRERMRGKE